MHRRVPESSRLVLTEALWSESAPRAARLFLVVGLLGACTERSEPKPAASPVPALSASAATLASARPPPQPPLLQGRLRCEAIVALDARSELKLGGKRRYTLDELRAEAGSSTLVDARRTWTIRGSAITLRLETLHREADGSYRFGACEATTKVEWRSAGELVVPSDIAAKASWGTFTRDARQSADCSIQLPKGHYRVTSEGGELLARRDDPEGAWAFLLAPDAGVDFEAEAKRLAGTPKQ